MDCPLSGKERCNGHFSGQCNTCPTLDQLLAAIQDDNKLLRERFVRLGSRELQEAKVQFLGEIERDFEEITNTVISLLNADFLKREFIRFLMLIGDYSFHDEKILPAAQKIIQVIEEDSCLSREHAAAIAQTFTDQARAIKRNHPSHRRKPLSRGGQ